MSYLAESRISEALGHLLEILPSQTNVYIVGGALRNLVIEMIYGRSPITVDIDIFLGNCHSLPTLQPSTVTDLGGLAWHPGTCPVSFDICLLKDFVILRKNRLLPSLNNLMASIDFTMNTLIYDVRRKQLYDGGAVHDIEKRLMEFHSPVFYSRPLTVYRILLLRSKTDFMLSPTVFRFIKHQVDLDILMSLKRILASRYDREGRKVLLQEYDRICAFPDYQEYVTNAPEAVPPGEGS